MSSEISTGQAQAVTCGPRHHFFGYYDKSPWDRAMRRRLALETTFLDHPPDGQDVAAIGLIDPTGDGTLQPLAETRAWNWQQGCMLCWLPGTEDREIIYNDLREGQFVAVIREVETGRERVLPRPLYAVAPDGQSALTVNFSRLHKYRPGYGYPGVPDPSIEAPAPEADGIFRLDLSTGETELIVSLAEIAGRKPRPDMTGSHHWINHLQFNADGTRLIFLHRWTMPGGWFTRLYTANPDGTEICLLADDDLVSHFDWYGSDQVLAWARVAGRGDHFFLFADQSDELETVGEAVLDQDGHCSYSPDRCWIMTDTYPDGQHRRTLILYHVATGRRYDIGKFYSPPELAGEIRCDLHPRWSPDGRQICFDSVHEGSRQMYVAQVSGILDSVEGE